jgi:hypothetical protein
MTMRNERASFCATFVNAIAVAIFVVGCLCPIVPLINGGDLGFVHFLVVALFALACMFVVALSRLRKSAR